MNDAVEEISARLRRRGDVTLELATPPSSWPPASMTSLGRWTGAGVATYCTFRRQFCCGTCTMTTFGAQQMTEHWLGEHADFKAFQCPHCPYMSAWQRCVRMHMVRHHGDRVSDVGQFNNSNIMAEITDFLSNLKQNMELMVGRRGSASPPSSQDEVNGVLVEDTESGEQEEDGDEGSGTGKRHHCPYCQYSTDRRDLYNRHENIHKSEKPFHCYVCRKMFNRADHVKKHFLRIHRDDPYDVKRIRRIPPKTLTAQIYYSRAPTIASADSQARDAIAAARCLKERSQTCPDVQQVQLADPEDRKPPAGLTSPAMETGDRGRKRGHLNSVGSAPGSPQSSTAEEREEDGDSDQKENHVEVATPNIKEEPGDDSATRSSDCSTVDSGRKEGSGGRRRTSRVGNFPCSLCPWRGFDSWCLKRHMNTHTKPYTCPLCPYKAARSERLTWHAAKVHGKKVCIKCPFICDDPVSLTIHHFSTHQNGQSRQGFTCVTCAENFRLHSELEAHMVSEHQRQMLSCSVCVFRTTDPAVLNDHVRYSHQRPSADQQDQPVILNVPSVLPPPPPPRVVTPPPPCDLCQAERPRLICTHRGDRLGCLAGGGCEFHTASADELRQHVQGEHGDGALRCPHCGAPFSSVLEYSLHWPLHHTSLCWDCAELAQRHFTLVASVARQPASSGEGQETAGGLDCSPFLNLEITEGETSDQPEPEDDASSIFTSVSDDEGEEDAVRLAEREEMKRSRKQACPKRVLSTSDGEEARESSNGAKETRKIETNQERRRKVRKV